MTWRTGWKAISDRIEGFVDAALLFSNLQGMDHNDYGDVVSGLLLPQAHEIFETIRSYDSIHHSIIPSGPKGCIERFIAFWRRPHPPGQGPGSRGDLQFRLTALAAFRSEFTYHLSDRFEMVRRMSERAFTHLQRIIVANPDVRGSWGRAFAEGEVACEKLGGAHLLWHGIWAFKTSAAGERTDLVLNEPLQGITDIETAAEALVLTEWKKVIDPLNSEIKAREAREQASRYRVGILGGIELAGYAYIVLVSEDILERVPDAQEGGITYRSINIAVNPSVPSRR